MDALLDEWTFSVRVTNNMASTITISPGLGYLSDFSIVSDCPPRSLYADDVAVRPDGSVSLSYCFVAYQDMESGSVTIDGWMDPAPSDYTTSRHFLGFDRDVCDSLLIDGMTCSVQSITHLIRDVEPEPVQCEAPPQTPTVTDGMPDVGSAVYHTHIKDILVSFDGPVELAEGWRDHISILAENGTHIIEVDGMHQNTRNLMSPGSMVWPDLTYSDYRDLMDAFEITHRMAPGPYCTEMI